MHCEHFFVVRCLQTEQLPEPGEEGETARAVAEARRGGAEGERREDEGERREDEGEGERGAGGDDEGRICGLDGEESERETGDTRAGSGRFWTDDDETEADIGPF